MKKRILLLIILLVLAAGGFVAWKFMGPSVSTSSGELLYVKTGSTYTNVKQDMLEKKYLGTSTWFDWASKILRFRTVKPGRYKITKGMSVWKLVRMLRAGTQSQPALVIPKIRTKEDF